MDVSAAKNGDHRLLDHCATGLQLPKTAAAQRSRLAAVPASSTESMLDGPASAPMGADREDAGQ